MNPQNWQENFALLHRYGLFSDQDINFARFICAEQNIAENYPLFLAAALTSNAIISRRYICLDLSSFSDNLYDWFDDLSESGLDIPEVIHALRELPVPPSWGEILTGNDIVVTIDNNDETVFTPLVRHGNLLYLYRTWYCECELSRIICSRNVPDPDFNPGLISGRIAEISKRFENSDPKQIDWQQIAIFTALRQQFSIITGGPGTGKTTVAAAIIAMLLERNPKLRIKLCAPTGKAQNRLQESIYQEMAQMNTTPEVIAAMTGLRATTIHRLIGTYPDNDYCKYNSRNLLAADVLLVDETSMVSQMLLLNLLSAIPEKTKIILLGDMNQLTSVESGMVLRELCMSAEINHASPACMDDLRTVFKEWNAELPAATSSQPLNDSIVELQISRRFDSGHGIGLTATAIRQLPDDHPETAAINDIISNITSDSSGQICLHSLPSAKHHHFEEALWQRLAEIDLDIGGTNVACMSYLNAPDLKSAYRIFAGFRILCSHRRGRYGVETVNYYIENQIRQNVVHRNGFFRGRPIIIRQNAPDKKLYNGDIGLTWTDETGNLKVFFPTVDNSGNESFFAVEPCNLPEYEAAFAMTIHKAQGTGFQKVIIILTPESRLLTRELLYTGITRAERHVELWTESSSIANALTTPTRRRSGLRHRLVPS